MKVPVADPPPTSCEINWTCAHCGKHEKAIVPDFMVTETIAAMRKDVTRHMMEQHPGEDR